MGVQGRREILGKKEKEKRKKARKDQGVGKKKGAAGSF